MQNAISILCGDNALLSSFPVFALIGVNIIQPGYFDAVMEKSWFYYAAAVMGIFLVANLLVMRKIIKIKV